MFRYLTKSLESNIRCIFNINFYTGIYFLAHSTHTHKRMHSLTHTHIHSHTKSLLDEPNPNSPANSQAAQLYQENRREYEKKVLAIVEESWMLSS